MTRPTSPATPSQLRPDTSIAVTVQALPGAYLDGDHIVLELTGSIPIHRTDATVRIPLHLAAAWATAAYTTVMVTYRDTIGADVPLVKVPDLDQVEAPLVDFGRCGPAGADRGDSDD